MAQVVASQRLFIHGIMAKGGGALERLAEADHVVFDKTGTLTSGLPRLIDVGVDPDLLAIAAAMASGSRHPYSRAIAAEGSTRTASAVVLADLREQAGTGLEARLGGTTYRLGRPGWALATETAADQSGVVLSADGSLLCRFAFQDELRAGARKAIERLRANGMTVEIVSGDHEMAVRQMATSLGLPYLAGVSPAGKVERIEALAALGRKVLMVGDGINDAPALAAAHVSMAAASATDVGRTAADFVFLRDDLRAVPDTIAVARRAQGLVRQNLMLAVGYNVLAIPIAVLGMATPLVAAIAMSVSSIAVVGNAMRLAARRTSPTGDQPESVLQPMLGAGR
jgi:Cu2+-exporting ATPase